MTQHYVGTKIVTAWPAQKDGEDGYSVKYADGYQSWSPKAAFESAYIALGHLDSESPYIQNLAGELASLVVRTRELVKFNAGDDFKTMSLEDQDRMRTQETLQLALINVLQSRLREHLSEEHVGALLDLT